MSLLFVLLSTVLSFVSTCIMSFLAITVEVTFWVAPIVSLAMVIILSQVRPISKEHMLSLLAAGSLGEMVGLSVGFSWPTLYFLHKDVFFAWMKAPVFFAGMVALLVFAAGGLAAIVAYALRPYLIDQKGAPFPTARLVYDLLYKVRQFNDQMILKGFLISGVWSFLALLFQKRLQTFWLLQVHAIPTFLSMGFVAGHVVVLPLFAGMLIRLFVLFCLNKIFFCDAQPESFVLTFALGMLFVVIGHSLIILLKKLYSWVRNYMVIKTYSKIEQYVRTRYNWIFVIVALLFCYFVLNYWHMTIWQQFYLVIACAIACMIVASIFASVGVLDLPNFGSFVVVPLGYLFYVSSQKLLIAFVFSTICLAVIVNLLFLWKLADFAQVSYEKFLKFQVLSFIVAAFSVGFIIWWYASVLNLNAQTVFSSQALLQEKFMTLAIYDWRIFILGFACALGLYFVIEDMAMVIAGCMMDFSVVGWLVLAGVIAYLVKDREKYYPFCFGIYASHAIWLFIQAILL